MALKIRMSRGGSKKRPFYRIVVADSRMPRDGRFLEKIGTYNPLLPKDNEQRLKLDVERAKHWISHGAKPSDRVARFLDDAGAWTRIASNNPQKAKPKAKAQQRLEAAQQLAKETPVEETPTEETPTEETPAEETPTEETPTEETPAEETPAEETPTEETPVEETPTEETPTEETPTEETPTEETPTEKEKAD